MSRALFALVVVCLVIGVAAPAAGQSAKPAASKSAPAAIVNLNTATTAQLAALPGVGDKAAQRIVEYRDKNGGFKKIEEPMNVKGFGEKSFLKLKPHITVGDAKPAAAK